MSVRREPTGDAQRLTVNGVSLAVEVRGEGPAVLFVHGYPLRPHDLARPDRRAGGLPPHRARPSRHGAVRCARPGLQHGDLRRRSGGAARRARRGRGGALRALDGGLRRLRVPPALAPRGCAPWSSWTPGPRPTRPRAGGRATRPPRLAREGGAEAIAEAMLPEMLGRSTADAAPEHRRAGPRMMAATPVAGHRRAPSPPCATGTTAPRSCPTLAGLPTLVIVGEEDALTPPDPRARDGDRDSGARLVVIPGAGHLPPRRAPGRDHRARSASSSASLRLKPFPPTGAFSDRAVATRSWRPRLIVLPYNGSGVAAKQFDPGAALLVLGAGAGARCRGEALRSSSGARVIRGSRCLLCRGHARSTASAAPAGCRC